MRRALALLVLLSEITTVFTVNISIYYTNNGVTAHVIPYGGHKFHKLRMHLAGRSADYVAHIEEIFKEYTGPPSERYADTQTMRKQARRRSRCLQRMNLNKLTNRINEDII